MSLQIGLVGTGGIGKKHIEAAVANGVKVACVADADQARANEAAALCDATAVTSASQLFADERVNAVIICVPNFLHKQLAIEAMQAGKDVLLEKPMGLNTAECDEINRVASDTGRVLQVGLVHRNSAVGKGARSVAISGQLGDVYHAKAALYLRRSVPGLGGWFTTKAKSGGGALIDLGVHIIDLALHVLGFPAIEEVSGRVYTNFGNRMRDYIHESMWAGPPNYDGVFDVDDAAHAFIRFHGGLTLDLNVTWAGNFPDSALPESLMGFFGTRGGMTFQLFSDHLMVAKEEARHNVDARVKLPAVDAFRDQLQDFLRAVETREVRGASGPQARTVQSVIDAIYKSSQQAAAVRI